ncbi:hypothetical protein N7539_004045 [Penicillium diatomitis]|uniref:EamA domain-containing protein n=1 Tax=Penicillium diatomitis TaxID=2819901 RepID=A0A9W9XD26_9EURO|nr:uncharacterized protein N7539_004045 [Penicillium diatomitis]KAJ5489155.1 hypothetical protein N7539_004045 [Penicillium diatomitis]
MEAPTTSTQSAARSSWIIIALASGAFAALNGLFAKLTTDTHTTAFAHSIAHRFGLESSSFLELLVRGSKAPKLSEKSQSQYVKEPHTSTNKISTIPQLCLGLNVLCNIIMWALFTRALTAGPSTTKVSITNTSANFLVTALLGMVIFRESVGGLWWLGAAMMGAGCILVGMRDGA